jgi:hypothetical protein
MLQAPDPPARLTILGADDKAALCTEATYLAVSSTSIGELHDPFAHPSGLVMPRIAHGASVTPEQVQQAEEALASQVAEIPLAFAVVAAAPRRDYGFMFRELQNPGNRLPTTPRTVKHLKALGLTMVEGREGAVGNAEDLPAIYTYFGQFIDHDITLEQGSLPSPQALVKDDVAPLALDKIRTLKNLRWAGLELDSLYGPTALGWGPR